MLTLIDGVTMANNPVQSVDTFYETKYQLLFSSVIRL